MGKIAARLKHEIEFARKHKNLLEANRHLLAELDWPNFWATQIWLVVLLFVYCALGELIRILGAERVRQMFFGVPRHKAA